MRSWQYNGVASWKTIYAWCGENLGPTGWGTNDWETLYFSRDEDYTLFMLKWHK